MLKTQPKILRRAIASIIDYGIYLGFVVLVFLTLGERTGEYSYSANGPEFFLFPLGWLIYFPLMESVIGQTLGKKIIGLKVVTKLGTRITFASGVKRRLLDMIELYFYGIIAIIVVRKTSEHQRVGDLIADTIVIGGENTYCSECRDEISLSASEVILGKFVCPTCQAENKY